MPPVAPIEGGGVAGGEPMRYSIYNVTIYVEGFMKSISKGALFLGLISFASIGANDRKMQPETIIKVGRVIGNALEENKHFTNAVELSENDNWNGLHSFSSDQITEIKKSVASSLKNSLEQDEIAIAISLLKKVKTLTAFSGKELIDLVLASGKFRGNDGITLFVEKAIDLSFSLKDVGQYDMTADQSEELYTKMLAMKLENKASTDLIHFFGALGGLHKEFEILRDAFEGKKINAMWYSLNTAIAWPYVLGIDAYFVNGWQQGLEDSGMKFKIVHDACTALLEELE